MRRGSALQNSTIALSHWTATNTVASLKVMNESRMAGAVCISLWRPGRKIRLEKPRLCRSM